MISLYFGKDYMKKWFPHFIHFIEMAISFKETLSVEEK